MGVRRSRLTNDMRIRNTCMRCSRSWLGHLVELFCNLCTQKLRRYLSHTAESGVDLMTVDGAKNPVDPALMNDRPWFEPFRP